MTNYSESKRLARLTHSEHGTRFWDVWSQYHTTKHPGLIRLSLAMIAALAVLLAVV